ncbi:MAG: branched-chain amino acid ABC transporter permease [Hyphomicrobiales bacterium]|nr:branched-chain amino acid ABC transporter permease [Hyphomicrobiales bacterium]MDE2114678.1 branched-chain amino acid ABC transporter permease [Hyphomicrobiales bacterium]
MSHTLKTALGVIALIALAAVGYFGLADNLAFMTQVVIMMIFVLSLDYVLGYAGISTLGHAAMFGTGAYAAAIFATSVSSDPILGILAGAVAGGAIALLSGFVLMRAHGLTLLMLSIAVTEVLHELANKYSGITGGADGLSFTPGPILGRFEFDFAGHIAYIYSVCLLLLVFIKLRVLTASPFGLAARGIRESQARMRAIGTPVYWRMLLIYTFGGAFAGVAGALSAQTTALVSLSVYDFQLSAGAVLMLILGGTGQLWGAILGTMVYMTVHQIASSVDPFNWLFIIGAMVLIVVYLVPNGLMALPALLLRWRRK